MAFLFSRIGEKIRKLTFKLKFLCALFYTDVLRENKRFRSFLQKGFSYAMLRSNFCFKKRWFLAFEGISLRLPQVAPFWTLEFYSTYMICIYLCRFQVHYTLYFCGRLFLAIWFWISTEEKKGSISGAYHFEKATICLKVSNLEKTRRTACCIRPICRKSAPV